MIFDAKSCEQGGTASLALVTTTFVKNDNDAMMHGAVYVFSSRRELDKINRGSISLVGILVGVVVGIVLVGIGWLRDGRNASR